MFQENFANVLSKKADTGHDRFKAEGRDLTNQSRGIHALLLWLHVLYLI